MQDDGHRKSPTQRRSADEYLGRTVRAIASSVQNGDNPPPATTRSNYLGTVRAMPAASCSAELAGNIVCLLRPEPLARNFAHDAARWFEFDRPPVDSIPFERRLHDLGIAPAAET
jgi:hypothetical protein